MSKITVTNLQYRYPLTAELALRGLSFEVEQGEFIGVIGRNGAGKSTLCAALTGLVPHFFKGAYGGSVRIDGINVKESKLSDLSPKIGIVFQNPYTQMSGAKETVTEELSFGLENLGVPKPEMLARIDDTLNLLEIKNLHDKNPFELSGGQMQRVAIASILVTRPELLVLDEPTSQLDPQGTREVFRALKHLSKQGMTIIMVEHKIEEIAEHANRVMLLDQGNIVAFDTPAKLFSLNQLAEHGVRPPVFTEICRGLDIRNQQSGLYPITLHEAVNEVQKFNESN
ncbi:energy-coupling factor ABC transporter ATP-binding protein [Sporolactobacillus pectinivorans]|uniref:energy-coupling factor ABC transporter ATP-binding protein n=1 Tax=Sporolactobacillus pectinivorans TaxID=1591408 RepID=UPI000C25E2BB|nr:ABC transporter ATP-binding protein [Sporolactobacillus pectinivorans]